MKFHAILCLIIQLLAVSINGEDLEEFPLDFDEDGQQSTETQPNSEINKISGSSSSLQTLEQQRNDVMKRVVANAMNKPGAKLRLSQVMPILRTMSGPQRLALAALVSAQVMASPREPLPPPHDPAHNVTSQLMLPISQDIATMFRGLGREEGVTRRGDQQVQQRSRQSYNSFSNNVVPNRREGHVPNEILAPPPPPRHPPSRSQVLQRQGQGHDQGQGQSGPFNGGEPTSEDCEFFTSSLCLEDTNYPKSDILKSLRNSQNKEAFSSLLQDAKYEIKDLDPSVNDHIERRQGDTSMIDNSKMCASRVEMAKPKRARTTMGNWKYIVNTGDYSQSLRLEMCLRPQASCSYIAPGVRSECMQVYNYHRLLTWDQSTGLAMDMFKVPTCCSCHIQNGFMGGQSPRPPMPSGLPTIFPDSGPESNFITSELMSQAMQRLPPGMLQGMRMRGDMLGHHNIPKRESNSGGAGAPRRPPQGTVIHRGPPLPLQDEAPPEAPPRYPPYHNNVRRTSLRNHSSDQDRLKIRGSIPLTPNQRHPDLPADNMISSVTSQQHLSPVTSHQLAAVTSQQQHPSQMTSHLSSVTSQQHPSHFSSVTSQHHPSQMTSRLPVTSPRSPVTSLTPVTSPVTTLVTVAPSRRINYSYHPIIDFFKTATSAVSNEEERSMDRADWRPVTEALLLHSKRQKLKE